MTNRRGVFSHSMIGCTLMLLAGCSSSSDGGGASGGAGQSSTSGKASGGSSAASSSASGGQGGGASSSSSAAGQSAGASSSGQAGQSSGGKTGTGGQGGKATTGGRTAGNTGSGDTGGSGAGGQVAGATGGGGGKAGTTTGGKTGGSGGQAGNSGSGGQTSGTGGSTPLVNGCTNGKAWPTANPTAAGPFKVFAQKKVGPLAGTLPDPIYGDEQQQFNVYRPENLKDSGYCHPILVWANGYKDNPEENPPKCIINRNDQWCGQYLPILNHLASHGFVVIASLSTATGSGDPLPTIVGLDWILEQAEDPSSVFYHRLDTANIGAFGHSFGGMSTCTSASEPRYKALATICGTAELKGVHTPMFFFCGGQDPTAKCPGIHDVFLTVKDQPAFFMNELEANHGSWVYGGPNSPSLSGAAAWFRAHLMGDTASRKYFYGKDCTFCKDNRVQAEQNTLMAQ